MAIDASIHEAAMQPDTKSNGDVKPVTNGKPPSNSNIIDIRSDTEEFSIRDDIRQGLSVPNGQEKQLPTMLLYDEEGLKLFEAITYLEEYYLTNVEIQVLTACADRIAQRIPDGAMIIELGSGNLRKVNILLQALERQRKNINYYALDLSLSELERTLNQIPHDAYQYVKCFGLWGTYDDGLEWIQKPPAAGRPKSILSLGSSIGNFTRESAAGFLRGFANALNIGDTMLIGIDACKDPEKVYHAYNDREGVTHRFISNGLLHANRLLGSEQFVLDDWRVIGEFDTSAGRHHAFVSPAKDVTIDGVDIQAGERIRIEESYKWSTDEREALWRTTGLVEGAFWLNATGDYGLHMMTTKPSIGFPTKVVDYAATPVPSLASWAELWAVWDTVTLRMIPNEELLNKPIKLRNACIFYLGHIPTFLDIHLTRATGQPSINAEFPRIFERGIDPDVDNPEQCHAHSEIPDVWPPLEEILTFQHQLRARVNALYKNGAVEKDAKVARAMWIGFEHEIMHLETLLYMLIQSEKMLPPAGVVIPDFESAAQAAKIRATENQWFEIPARKVTVGLNDPDTTDGPKRFFGWDNENPKREANVHSFLAKGRAITNGEYAKYLISTGTDKLPASWATQIDSHENGHTNGHSNGNGYTNGSATEQHNAIPDAFLKGKAVRTVFGFVPLRYALDWPVFASYDEVAGCAKWMGGRVPTADEVRSIYDYAQELKENDLEKAISTTIPAVNGHLSNNGVEETPPSNSSVHEVSGESVQKTVQPGPSPNPHELYVDLTGANVGLANWHPTAVTPNGNKLAGRGDLGGVWEWTSTVLEPHDGFKPMSLYPGYTSDFFDGKHNVVLGGSWATHPRLAGRKSFVNWYQRNYPYAWAGARVVKDL